MRSARGIWGSDKGLLSNDTPAEPSPRFHALACLLPIVSGGGIPVYGWINPFWQMVFGSGGYALEYILPMHGRGSKWDLIGIVLFPWVVIAILFVASGRVWRLPRPARKICTLAFLSSFLIVAPAEKLLVNWPALVKLPAYISLFD